MTMVLVMRLPQKATPSGTQAVNAMDVSITAAISSSGVSLRFPAMLKKCESCALHCWIGHVDQTRSLT